MCSQDRYGLDWVYIFSAPIDDFLGVAFKSQRESVGGSIGAIAAILVLAIVFAYFVAKRLAQLCRDMGFATKLSFAAIQKQDSESYVAELRAISTEFSKLVCTF